MPDESEKQDLRNFMRQLKPDIARPDFGLRRTSGGDIIVPKRTDSPVGSVTREPRQPAFPADDAQEPGTQVNAGGLGDVAFALSDASTTENDQPVYKVKIFDGKYNGTFPTGMGFGNYVLPVGNMTGVTKIVFAGATFNPQTLSETSRFLDVKSAADYPEARVEDDLHGFIYVQLGFVYLDATGSFKIVQTYLGDINLTYIYGADNAGKPAFLPVFSPTGFLDLDFLP